MSRCRVLAVNVVSYVSMVVLGLGVAWAASEFFAKKSPSEPEAVLSEVMELIEQRYVSDVPREQLIGGALRGMTETLDMYSRYYTESEWDRFSAMSEGSEPGIGIRFARVGDAVIILRVIPESPADTARLQSATQILEIDGQTLSDDVTASEVKAMIGRAPLTFVLGVTEWPIAGKTRSVTLTRGAYKLESVYSRAIPAIEFCEEARGGRTDSIGYLHVSTFNHQTADDFREQLSDLLDQGVGGLVVDLRGNGGGTLAEAVSVVASFIDTECVLTSVMRDSSRVYPTKDEILAPDRPLVILVNGGSASASEVAAGALQDYRRALVLGEHTLGKGVIQTVFKLGSRESGVKLTTARYMTPAGRSLQKKRRKPRNAMERGGIIPDVVIPLSDREWRDVLEVRDRWTMSEAIVRAMQEHPDVFRSVPEDFRDRQLDGAVVYLATGRRPRMECK